MIQRSRTTPLNRRTEMGANFSKDANAADPALVQYHHLDGPPPRRRVWGDTYAVVKNAEECEDALERALDAITPPLDVYGGIVRLIAE